MNKKVYDGVKNHKVKIKNMISSAAYGTIQSNKAEFKMIQGYLNQLVNKKKFMVEDEIFIKYNLVGGKLTQLNTIDIVNCSQAVGSGYVVILEIFGSDFSLKFQTYQSSGKMVYTIAVDSVDKTTLTSTFVYKYLIGCTIIRSDVKGAFLKMRAKSNLWEVADLEKRTFDDIFLPENILLDLRLYRDIFKLKGNVLRYLMVGSPGTGKTESTLVLANELNKLGVTVIKTPVCEQFDYKVQLAAMLAPSVIILDDLDLSLGGRDSGGFSPLLRKFLDVLDGTDKLPKNVGILATTNAAQLLDLAAQRPGRFDKTLLFDTITKDNIRNIIIKSLDKNFKLKKTNKAVKMYTEQQIIDKFFDAGLTGSHIYNIVEMLKLRYDTLDETVSPSKIIKDVEEELKIIKKIRNNNFLTDKLDRRESGSGMGFQHGDLDEEVPPPLPIPNELR